MYRECDVVLDSSDYVDTEIAVLETKSSDSEMKTIDNEIKMNIHKVTADMVNEILK
jgi:hypothetical protein